MTESTEWNVHVSLPIRFLKQRIIDELENGENGTEAKWKEWWQALIYDEKWNGGEFGMWNGMSSVYEWNAEWNVKLNLEWN